MPDVCLQVPSHGKLKGYAQAFDFARHCGFDGVELRSPPPGLDYDLLHLLSLEHDLPVRSVIAPSPFSTEGLFAHGKNYAMDELKPDFIVVEVPRASVLNWPALAIFRNNVLLFKDAYGKDHVAVENGLPGRLQRPVLDIKRMRDFCYEHDVSVNFDVSSCAAAGMDVLLSCDMLVPRIRNVHFSDYGGESACSHLVPGKGLLPLGMLLSRLNDYHYDGLITVEIDLAAPGFDDDDPVLLYSEIIGFIRSYFHRRSSSPSAATGAA